MKFQLSIITITFNNYEELLRTYNSIHHLLSEKIQWVVVDGGTVVESKDFLNTLKKNKFVNVHRGKDKGIYDAMNKGLNNASGKYVWFLNSGDISFLDIANKLNFSQFQDINIFNIQALNSDLEPIKWKGLSTNTEELRIYPCIPHQSTIFSKKVFENYGGYDLRYKIVSDYEKYCLFYTKNLSFRYFQGTLLSGFVNDGISSEFKNSLKILREIKNIQNHHFRQINLRTSSYYYLRYIFSQIFPQKFINKTRNIIFKSY